MVTIAVSLCPSSFLCLTLDVVVGVHLKTSGAFLTETKTCSSLKNNNSKDILTSAKLTVAVTECKQACRPQSTLKLFTHNVWSMYLSNPMLVPEG